MTIKGYLCVCVGGVSNKSLKVVLATWEAEAGWPKNDQKF